MTGQEITLKTEADDTAFVYFCVYKQPQWQWALRQTEGDPITRWHHCDKCEWELNHFHDPISVACLQCKPIDAITSLATSGKQYSLIIVQANVLIFIIGNSWFPCRASSITSSCCSQSLFNSKRWPISCLSVQCNIPNLCVYNKAWGWLNSLEGRRWMGSYAGSTEPSHKYVSTKPAAGKLRQALQVLQPQVCCGRGEPWYLILKWHMGIWLHPINRLYMSDS